jgi:hypothetical protein
MAVSHAWLSICRLEKVFVSEQDLISALAS